jgi:hypothetical protein
MTDAMTASKLTVLMTDWHGVTSHDGPPVQGAADGEAAAAAQSH